MHPCAACGSLVFEKPAGSLQTCPVCGWIDDFDQLVHPDFVVGANGCSLREAQAKAAGIAHSGAKDPRWRPLRKGEQPRAEYASEVCAIGNPDRELFEPYWSNPHPDPLPKGEGES
jgi:hypothetical protein